MRVTNPSELFTAWTCTTMMAVLSAIAFGFIGPNWSG